MGSPFPGRSSSGSDEEQRPCQRPPDAKFRNQVAVAGGGPPCSGGATWRRVGTSTLDRGLQPPRQPGWRCSLDLRGRHPHRCSGFNRWRLPVRRSLVVAAACVVAIASARCGNSVGGGGSGSPTVDAGTSSGGGGSLALSEQSGNLAFADSPGSWTTYEGSSVSIGTDGSVSALRRARKPALSRCGRCGGGAVPGRSPGRSRSRRPASRRSARRFPRRRSRPR